MITEISKFYIEGTGNPNADTDINAGFAGMPTVYHDSVTKDIYNYFSTLTVGSRWRKPTITSNGYREYRANFLRVDNPDIYEIHEIINTFGNSIPFELNLDPFVDGIYTFYGEDSFDLPLTVQTSLILDDSTSVDEIYSVYHKFLNTSTIAFYTTSSYDANTAANKHIPYSAFGQSGFSVCIIMKDF